MEERLIKNGWLALSDAIPPFGGGDAENGYISKQVNFYINDNDFSSLNFFTGLMFIKTVEIDVVNHSDIELLVGNHETNNILRIKNKDELKKIYWKVLI